MNNYPNGYQVLCFNHNFAKAHSPENWNESYTYLPAAKKQ